MNSTPVPQGSQSFTIVKQQVCCALAAEVLRVSGALSLRVFGWSMLPSIWPGDIVAVRRAQVFDISPGKIVLCAQDEGFVLHRAVSCTGDALITRGDAHLENDPPVLPSAVLGEVVSIRRGRSYIVPKARLTLLQELCCFPLRRSALLRRVAQSLHSLRQAMSHSHIFPEPVL